MKYIDEYRSRGYVKAINWGIILFFIGILIGCHIIGNVIALIGGLRHHADSNRRIAELEEKLRQLGGTTPSSGGR